jgi:starvation-inducible DNA-binding protein
MAFVQALRRVFYPATARSRLALAARMPTSGRDTDFLNGASMTATIDTGLTKTERADVAQELTKVLADSFAVYLKTHGYHWNVRGPEFFSFHNLLEQQYRDIWDALDDIAERIRALGVLAPQSYSAFGNLTSIKDGDPEKDATAMLKELMQDHETLIATARTAFETASEAGDEASADLMTQRLAAHEKFAWMLRSTLGGR